MSESRGLSKIISGGQTGVDRAALDTAMALGMTMGGWCPKGRRAEDGAIPERYPLQETPTAHYPQRTEWNVRDSDATLVLTRGALAGGTRLTTEFAARMSRPCLVVRLGDSAEIETAVEWLGKNRVGVLNVAGPRESTVPGIYAEARQYLAELLAKLSMYPTS